MIVFFFAFVFAYPFWMLALPVYLASAIRQRYLHAIILPASLLIGTISTMTSLAYRECMSGTWRGFDESYLTTFVYRGFPFGWIGWNSFDLPAQPIGHVFLDLLIWTVAAFGALYLLSLVQILGQWKLARADKLLIVGVVMAALPLLIASVASGRGC